MSLVNQSIPQDDVVDDDDDDVWRKKVRGWIMLAPLWLHKDPPNIVKKQITNFPLLPLASNTLPCKYAAHTHVWVSSSTRLPHRTHTCRHTHTMHKHTHACTHAPNILNFNSHSQGFHGKCCAASPVRMSLPGCQHQIFSVNHEEDTVGKKTTKKKSAGHLLYCLMVVWLKEHKAQWKFSMTKETTPALAWHIGPVIHLDR